MALQDVLNFEQNLEESFKQYLLINGVEDIYTSFSSEDLKDQRIDIRVEIVGADEHQTKELGPVGDQNLYNATLIVSVLTERENGPIPPDGYTTNHAFRKSLIRKLFLASALNGNIAGITEYNSPESYGVSVWRKAGETGDLQDDNVDIAELFYSFKFFVRFL